MASSHTFEHFHLKVLNFGLTNALPSVNIVFKDVIGSFVWFTLHDILIFTKNLGEHEDACPARPLDRPKQCFCAKASNCTFCFSELEYLDYMVGCDRIKMNPRTVSDAVDWHPPSQNGRMGF